MKERFRKGLSFDGNRYYIEIQLPDNQSIRLSGVNAEALLAIATRLYYRRMVLMAKSAAE